MLSHQASHSASADEMQPDLVNPMFSVSENQNIRYIPADITAC